MFRSSNVLYLFCGALIVFALGVIGYTFGACQLPVGDRFLEALKLFLRAESPTTCAAPWSLVFARYAAPYIVPFVALFATIRLAVTNLRYDLRVARARYRRGHFIVCGLGDTGMQIVENLRHAGKEVIAIDLVSDSPHAATAERSRVAVVKGDAAERSVLEFAGLRHANTVIVCTGEDAQNVDIALRIEESIGDTRRRNDVLTALIELRHEWLFAKLIDHDKEPLGSPAVEVRPFNIYQNAARILIRSSPAQPVDDPAAKPFIVIGFGSMGREVTMHYLRAAPVPLRCLSKVLVLDRVGEEIGRNFVAGIPSIERFAEVEFVTADVSVEAVEKWGAIEARLSAMIPVAIAVCLPDDKLSLFVALRLRALFDGVGRTDMSIFVRLRRHHRLGEFAAHLERLPQLDERLRVFGSLEELLKVDILIDSRLDTLAKACHEHYREMLAAERPDSANARPWNILPEHFKMSSRREADHIFVKLVQVGLAVKTSSVSTPIAFTDAETEVLSRLEHRRWMIERWLRGWRHGSVRDDAHYFNPYLVEWDELPDNIRESNRKTITQWPEMLARAGMEIYRPARGAA